MQENNGQRLVEIRIQAKNLLIDELSLKDTTPEKIKDDEILLWEGLGLESLDAVETVLLLQRNFCVEIKDM